MTEPIESESFFVSADAGPALRRFESGVAVELHAHLQRQGLTVLAAEVESLKTYGRRRLGRASHRGTVDENVYAMH